MFKANTNAKDLKAAMASALRLVPGKPGIPIHAHLLLESTGDGISISSCDYDVQCRITMPGEAEEEGSCTVPAKPFGDLLGSMGNVPIYLESENPDGDALKLTAGLSEYHLLGLAAQEFPEFPEFMGNIAFIEINAHQFGAMIGGVEFAASADESRPQLTGINLALRKNKIHVCGAEMARLSRWRQGIESDLDIDLIVPARAMKEVARICSAAQEDETLKIDANQNQIAFRLEEAALVSRLIDGKYPSFEKVIPKDNSRRLVVDREGFLKCLKRCLTVSGENKRVTLRMIDGKVALLAESGGTGRGLEKVDARCQGDDLELSFDGRFLMQYLMSFTAPTLVMEFNAPLSPGVFYPEGTAELDRVYVQMPLTLS